MRFGTKSAIRSGRLSGFTLIELLVVVVVIGIIAATAMANFIGAQVKVKNAAVLSNMHTAQVAAESYGTDNGGFYAAAPAGIYPFFPGGGNSAGGAAGQRATNPFTAVANEALFQETISDTATLDSVRSSPPGASPGTAGQVGYCSVDSPPTSYCVTGGDSAARRIGGGTKTTVFSNH